MTKQSGAGEVDSRMNSTPRAGHALRRRLTAGAASCFARFAKLFLLPLLTVLALAAGPAAASDPSGSAVKLSAAELLKIYGGKTWQWGEGGGYFAREGRKFRARVVGETGEITTTGVWRITDSGKLCFSATWGSADGTVYEACFEHVSDGGDIYQRRLPDGGWYIFKHAKLEPDDEYGKLARGDRVSSTETTD